MISDKETWPLSAWIYISIVEFPEGTAHAHATVRRDAKFAKHSSEGSGKVEGWG